MAELVSHLHNAVVVFNVLLELGLFLLDAHLLVLLCDEGHIFDTLSLYLEILEELAFYLVEVVWLDFSLKDGQEILLV